jgi:hypothetical protein
VCTVDPEIGLTNTSISSLSAIFVVNAWLTEPGVRERGRMKRDL